MIKINDLEKLLLGKIPNGSTIKSYMTKPLVAPGQNFGSIVLSVTIQIENAAKKTTTDLQLVAKVLHRNELVLKIFNTPTTFKREILMYEIILPALIKFQIEYDSVTTFSYLPKCYGARTSLNSDSEVVDADAIILLENLTYSGFITVNKVEGFDLDTTKVVLKELAVFHAIPVAFKILKPDTFGNVILSHLGDFKAFTGFPEDARRLSDNSIMKIATSNPECVLLADNIIQTLHLFDEFADNGCSVKEPFATITHNDMWINNVMIKRMKKKPLECKILDFQFIDYGSPCHDLIFFLYTSAQKEVLQNSFDYLIRYYYDTFMGILQSLRCETFSFSYERYLEELADAAKIQFKRILIVLTFILGEKNTEKTLEEMDESEMTTMNFESPKYVERVPEVIMDFYQRGWI